MLTRLAGITAPQADAVTAFYLKERIAKTDYVMGRINVKHGAFLDAAVIRRAAMHTTKG
jgi:hypothetical protein